MGLLSEDVQTDRRFRASDTVTNLGLHSVLCVPLITQEGRRLGVIQLDRFRKGIPYGIEDLHLLTAISLQVAVVLENVEFHAERLREERLHQELALAREIQQGFLPAQMEKTAGGDVELFGRVFPARQVAGDLYDYFLIGGGRLAFCIGDVSGKGMPAALFMVAVRTLFRHLVKETTPPGPPFARGGGGFVSPTRSGEPAFSPPCEGGAGGGPVQVLTRLHAALADDNPACMFVTLAHGTIAPDTGQVLLASAGHPAPLLRRADGTVEAVPLPSGRLLGYEAGDLHLQEIRLTLGPGETLVFVTDGVLEARSPVAGSMFGLERLKEVIAGFDVKRCPAECADQIKTAIELFTGSKDMQDDVTVLILRRGLASASLALIPAGKKK